MLFRSFLSKTKPTTGIGQTGEPFVAVLSATELVRVYELTPLIMAIKQLVAVTDKHFELYYLGPIHEFLVLTQCLGKDSARERFSAIIRGLKLRRPLLLPTGVESESIRKSKDLWTYITFVALLLCGIGPAVLGKSIVIKDSFNDRTPARRWHPLIAPIQPPQVYRVTGEQDATRYSTAYFLPRLLPNACLHWIAQDAKAFNTLSELIVTPNPESLLGALLLRAHNIAASVPEALQSSDPSINSAQNVNPTESTEHPPSAGILFYKWLKNHIKTASSSSLEPLCFNTNYGLALICPDIFKHYANNNGGAWKAIQNDFLTLEYHAPNPKNNGHYHMLTVPGRGNANTLIIPGLSIDSQKHKL